MTWFVNCCGICRLPSVPSLQRQPMVLMLGARALETLGNTPLPCGRIGLAPPHKRHRIQQPTLQLRRQPLYDYAYNMHISKAVAYIGTLVLCGHAK